MALAVFIDATDGALARAARVKELIPWFDGSLLDNITTISTTSSSPLYSCCAPILLPPQDALWLLACRCSPAAYGFCRKDAKTDDYFFLGFPSYWNIVAFYLYVLNTPLWLNAFVTIALSSVVFVPIKFIYPSRAQRFRASINFFGGLGESRFSGFSLPCRHRRAPWRLPHCCFQPTIRHYRFGSNFGE